MGAKPEAYGGGWRVASRQLQVGPASCGVQSGHPDSPYPRDSSVRRIIFYFSSMEDLFSYPLQISIRKRMMQDDQCGPF